MTTQETKKIRLEVKLPIILIHTPWGLNFFDRVAKTPGARAYAKAATYLMPVITALAFGLIISQVVVIFSDNVARQAVKAAGPQSNILIPGINPYVPIVYGWIALVVAMIVHESAHGITARVYGYKVESTGILLFLGLPIGAFVNIPQQELERATLKHKASIMTAGVVVNGIIAIACLIALYAITITLTPIPQPGPQYGVEVASIFSGSAAQELNITKGSIIQSVAGQQVRDTNELGDVLSQNLGKTVSVTWLVPDGNSYNEQTGSVTLPAQANGKPILGVSGHTVSPDPKMVLDRYKNAFGRNPLAILLPPTVQQGSVPFSDFMAGKYTSPLGDSWAVIANMIFWLWFINFNIGVFNALPIGPFDGGQLYRAVMDHRLKSKAKARTVSIAISCGVTLIIVALVAVPYLAR